MLRDRARIGGALLRLIDRTLARQATAEALGTAFLVAIVVGSGIAAQRMSPNDVGLQLLENSIATGAGLVALILAFGPVSGAHFNPVVTLADRIFGGIAGIAACVYVVAQVVGACVGAMVANLMFDLDAVNVSTHTRSSGGLWLGEFVATIGLAARHLRHRAHRAVRRSCRSPSAGTSPPRTGSRRRPRSRTRRSRSRAR